MAFCRILIGVRFFGFLNIYIRTNERKLSSFTPSKQSRLGIPKLPAREDLLDLLNSEGGNLAGGSRVADR